MIAESLPFIPPAPKIHARELPVWRFIPVAIRNILEIWPDFAFDVDFNRRRSLGVDGLLLNDPADIRHVLTANAANYRRPPAVARIARPLGGDGLFMSEGAKWRRQRRLLAPTFAPSGVNGLVAHFQAAGDHLLRRLASKPVANLSLAFQDTALETVLRALFSLPENDARENFTRMGREFLKGVGQPNLFDALARSETAFAFADGGRRRFQKKWFGAIDAIVAARRAAPHAGDSRDLLDALLALRDAETGEGLAAEEIRDQCGTMFFAGSETTARCMFWAAYLLTQDQAEQERVRREIAGFAPDRVASLDDLQHWPRLRNVLLEALRLYPPLPLIQRQALGPDEIHGERIKAGALLWVSPWVLHRHRKYWENPTAFQPDRFAGVAAPWTQMPAYMPFGAGPRICIGLHFALAEAQIVLASVLQRFSLRLADTRPVLPVAQVTTAPSHEPDFILEKV